MKKITKKILKMIFTTYGTMSMEGEGEEARCVNINHFSRWKSYSFDGGASCLVVCCPVRLYENGVFFCKSLQEIGFKRFRSWSKESLFYAKFNVPYAEVESLESLFLSDEKANNELAYKIVQDTLLCELERDFQYGVFEKSTVMWEAKSNVYTFKPSFQDIAKKMRGEHDDAIKRQVDALFEYYISLYGLDEYMQKLAYLEGLVPHKEGSLLFWLDEHFGK